MAYSVVLGSGLGVLGVIGVGAGTGGGDGGDTGAGVGVDSGGAAGQAQPAISNSNIIDRVSRPIFML